MKGGVFGAGPPITNGTRQFWKPGTASKAEVATGQAKGADSPFRPTWMDDRQDLPCKQPWASPDWWFAPEENEHGDKFSTRVDMEYAIAFCQACPQRAACELFGLQNAGHGIWGGQRVDNLKVARRRELLAKVEREQRRRRAS